MKFVYVLALLFSGSLYAAPVEFQVQNVKHSTGSIFFSMFTSQQSWDAQNPDMTLQIATAIKGTSTLKADLAPGEYAFFVYHDVDGNGQLKQNPFGMPVEPYAFSNNFKLQFSKPPWSKLKFTVTATGAVQNVTLVQ